MPELQVLPGVPGFGQQLGQVLGNALGNIGQGLIQRKTHQNDKNILNQIAQNPNLSSMELIGLVGKLSPELQKNIAPMYMQQLKHVQNESAIAQKYQDYINQGIDPHTASYLAHATVGGQTEGAKYIFEQKKRGLLDGEDPSQQFAEGQQPSVQTEQKPISVNDQIKQAVKQQDIGATPAEVSRRSEGRYKTGLPIYNETEKRLKGLSDDARRLTTLEKLNQSGKLPSTFGRLNVDREGNLRFPFLASPEAQAYVKTLNEFSTGAKDSFGARVTNFDLQQFMLRYPTLLNSEEGRRLILDQMKLVNEINKIYYGNLKKVFSSAGGVRKIDADRAQDIASEISKPQIAELEKRAADNQSKIDNIGNTQKQEEARKIFEEAGRDPVKARQLAKERGLNF